jgi:PAS domain-containing protein
MTGGSQDAPAPTGEQLYRALAGGYPDGVVAVYDDTLRFLRAEGPELAQHDREVVGKTLGEILEPAASARAEAALRAALGGETRVAEVSYGGFTYVVHVRPVLREDGSVAAGMILAQNVTQAVLTQAALREDSDRYRRLFERAGEAIYFLSAEGKNAGAILDANRAAALIHGYSIDELRSMR